jgi:hypothetical protein
MAFKKIFYAAWLVFGIFQLGDASGAEFFSQEPAENTVRVARSFFERQTAVETIYARPTGNTAHFSRVAWNEERNSPPTVSAKSSGENPIAVFNDHVGCAEIRELPPMRLCFNIQDDVSSLTLASNQMSVDGLDSIEDLSCISASHFLGAKKNDNSGFTVSYRLSPKASERCKSAGGVLNLTMRPI